jgi:hypothetical protein
MKKVIVLLITIGIIGAGAATYFFFLQPPTVEKVTLLSVDDITRTGFKLKYAVIIHNPNLVGMNITNMKYNVLLKPTNQTVYTGTSDGGYIPPGGSIELSFVSTAYFGPLLTAGLLALLSNSVPMETNGVLTATIMSMTFNVPFSQSFDAYPSISDALRSVV